MTLKLTYNSHIEPHEGEIIPITLCGSMRKYLPLFEEIKNVSQGYSLQVLSPKLGDKVSEDDGFVVTANDDVTLSRLALEHGHIKHMIESDIVLILNPGGVPIGKSAFAEALLLDFYQIYNNKLSPSPIFFLDKPGDDEEPLIKDIYTNNVYQKYVTMHNTLREKLRELRRITYNINKDKERIARHFDS